MTLPRPTAAPISRRRPLPRASAFAFLLALAPVAEAATLGEPWTLERAVGQSEFIFEGTVTAIAFRDSDPVNADQAALPHVFVTYRVEDVIRGQAPSQEITLRFLGGWSGQTGRIMRVPHAPLFKQGDRDILFAAAGNGAVACPLVGCGRGRFRIWQSGVYSDRGFALRRNGESDLSPGADRMPVDLLSMEFPPAPEDRLADIRRQLADSGLSAEERAELARRLEAMSAPRIITLGREVTNQPAPSPSTPPLGVAAFKALIQEIAGRYPPATAPMPSASLDTPFQYPVQELSPNQPPNRFPEPRQLTPEQRLLQQNNGNPVLRPQ
jgi:hypothetical protein